MNVIRGLIIYVCVILAGCNYTKLKQSVGDNQNFGMPQGKVSELSYELLAQKVFASKCVTCHGGAGGVRLESYADVKRELSNIKASVFEQKTMPKRGALSNEELTLLWNWIRVGAPEFAQNGSQGPEPDPIQPTFESIDKHVFQGSCIECHNSTGSGKRILLDKDSLLDSPLELIVPGNPDESGLVIAIERNDAKRMPPPKDGFSGLKEDEKLAIRKWIENGAKD